MRLPVLVEVDFATSRRGLPARLDAPVGGGRAVGVDPPSVLARTLEGVLAASASARPPDGPAGVPGGPARPPDGPARVPDGPALTPALDIPVIVCPRRDEVRARAAVGDLPVRWFVHDHEDVPMRERLRQGRKWGKEGWRGGIGDAYFVCEAGNPIAWEALYRQEKWDAALVVPAEAALVDPRLLAEIARHYLDRRWGSPVLLSTAPPGLAGDIFHYSLVSRLCEARTTLHQVFPFRLDDPSTDPDLHKASYSFRESITGARGRFLADSRWGVDWVRRVWSAVDADAERPEAASIIDWSQTHPDAAAGPVPEEIQLEWGPEGSGARPTRGTSLSNDTWGDEVGDEAIWSQLEAAARERDDLLVTIGGSRGDPLRDPRLLERIRALKDAGAYGLHLVSPGSEIDDALAAALIEAPLDAITIEMDCPDADLATERGLAPDWTARSDGLERLVAAREASTRPGPFILAGLTFDERTAVQLEPFVDRWFGRLDRILIRGVEGERGEAHPTSMGDFSPPGRFACGRLTTQLRLERDGRVPLCARDPYLEHAVGDLRHASLAAVWQGDGLRQARSQHADGQWAEVAHCGPCRSWCRFD